MKIRRLVGKMPKNMVHWLGHVLSAVGLYVAWSVGSQQNERAERALRDVQTGLFEPTGAVTLVDTAWLEAPTLDTVVAGENLGEVVPVLKFTAPATISIDMVNRGKEAAKVITAFAHNYPIIPRERTIWDWFLDGRLIEHVDDVDPGPCQVVQPGESTIVDMPIAIFRADSSGRTFAHVAVVTSSVVHSKLALTYLWISIRDPYRAPQGFRAFSLPQYRVSLVPQFSCEAKLIEWDVDRLDEESERRFNRVYRKIMELPDVRQTAEIKLLYGK